MSAPEADMRVTNSSRRFSTTSASIAPMADMATESSRNSSSSSMPQILAPYCSPSASMSTAARSRPVRGRLPVGAGRLASVDIAAARSRWVSAEVFSAAFAIFERSDWVGFTHPLTDDGNGFARILVGDLTDLLHRLGVHLALNLGDIDLPGGFARLGLHVLDRAECVRQLAACRQHGNGLRFRASTRRTSGRTTISKTTRPSRPI